jgi:hypothetical protein
MAAALAAGCGNVVKSERAIDAGLPDALTCAAPERACGGTCVQVTSNNDHCGDCESKCAVGSTCTTGHCVDNVTTCAQILMVNDQQPSGFYTLIDGSLIYCDMTTMVGYSSLVMAQWDAGPTGYAIVSAADLQNASEQTAFIQLYNKQGGLTVPTTFVSGNCCFKNDATTTSMLDIQSDHVFPSAAGATQCNPQGGYVVGTTYQFEIQLSATPSFVTNMPPNFFATNPATASSTTIQQCAVANNPAVFWKVIQ